MAAVIHLPYQRETVVGQTQPEYRSVPAGFSFFPEESPPDPIQEIIDCYNYYDKKEGEKALFARLPELEHADNGLSFVRFGAPSEVLIVAYNPFATDLSPMNRLRGLFLHDSLAMMGVTDADGNPPQVLQIASACRTTDIPLTPRQHLQLARGDNSPVTDKAAEVVFKYFPDSKRVISTGYSLSGFLTPDILLSMNRDKDVLAGLIANPPGVQPEPMRTILDHFEHAGTHIGEHLKNSGLRVLEPKNILSWAGKLCERAEVIADVVWRPTNLSLWRSFSRGRLLERVQTLHQQVPQAVINFAFGYEDPLCSPLALEAFLRDSAYGATVIEHGDHAWGMNLPRSIGHLATSQIQAILAPKLRLPHQTALAA